MNQLYGNSYINLLHQQISHSVDKIKGHSPEKVSVSLSRGQQTKEDAGSCLNNRAYCLLSEAVSYQLTGQSQEDIGAKYVSDSYRYASNVNKNTTILIDFMFKNNREFDFKV